MTPQALFVATVAVCLVNGLVSPMLGPVWHLHPVWMPEIVPATRETVFYGASLIVATATLLLAALPAAIAEHGFGVRLERAMLVWLGAAVLLTLLGLR
jgi:hypothetical protein